MVNKSSCEQGGLKQTSTLFDAFLLDWLQLFVAGRHADTVGLIRNTTAGRPWRLSILISDSVLSFVAETDSPEYSRFRQTYKDCFADSEHNGGKTIATSGLTLDLVLTFVAQIDSPEYFNIAGRRILEQKHRTCSSHLGF
jgi:hypothetical protein